jgi:putative acyl-CoA dehydrogenase
MPWQTHAVSNQYDELRDYNVFATDAALREGLQHCGGAWAADRLGQYGKRIGSAHAFALAEAANRNRPEARVFDARGRRVDQVEFHPSWHELLSMYREAGFLSLAFADGPDGRWCAAAAGFYLHAQVEAGTMCPISMTQASIPLLQREPAIWDQVGTRLMAYRHDPHDLPIAQKQAVWVGMGMTEKQGGSDVRSNATRATPVGDAGRGAAYVLRGHKWFFSAPMCDAHLVVADCDDGHSCFFVPRWRPDGTRNAVHIQRLKDKVGNRSNASGEVEFDDAWGVLMGEAGHGIRTIIEMATYTRLSCVIASAAFVRQCLVQALAYARQRMAFGRRLAEQPLMRTVLADIALESEAAVALALRLAQAFEGTGGDADMAWKRILTPAAKFWVCKRAVEVAGEAMEVFGGNGYVEESSLARLYREAPVNSIWEGSGNVMCLDVLRAVRKDAAALEALLSDLARLGAGDSRIEGRIAGLRQAIGASADALESLGRAITQELVLVAQACLLRERAPNFVAEGFAATRLGRERAAVLGAIDPHAIDVLSLLERAYPA